MRNPTYTAANKHSLAPRLVSLVSPTSLGTRLQQTQFSPSKQMPVRHYAACIMHTVSFSDFVYHFQYCARDTNNHH